MPFVDVRLHDRNLTRCLRVYDLHSLEFVDKKIVAVNTEEGWYEHYVTDDDGMLVMEQKTVGAYAPKCERVVGKFELRHRNNPDVAYTEQPEKVK